MLSVEAVETFFSAITFALTLLLVFKTNSSYARWWEARAKVGLLTSTAHDLARAVSQELHHIDIVVCATQQQNGMTPQSTTGIYPSSPPSTAVSNQA
jgi:predicted membrane chloride channel (bestrophin family)